MDTVKLPIDHNDLVKSGHISSDSLTMTGDSQRFACYIEKAGQRYPKFNITTKADVEKAVNAINVNPELPDKIATVAKYWIKQAAAEHGVDTKWDNVTPPDDLSEKTIVLDEGATHNVSVYGFTLKTASFTLHTASDVRDAEQYFLANIDDASGSDRHVISRQICKAASDTKYEVDKATRAYSNLSYGNNVPALLKDRASAANNDMYKTAYEELSAVYHDVSPLEFLNIVASLDKSAGISDCDFPAHKMFIVNSEEVNMNKVADQDGLYKQFVD